MILPSVKISDMRSEFILINGAQTTSFNLKDTSSKANLAHVLFDAGISYLNEVALFLVHFNTIPNSIEQIEIDCRKANKWLNETYKAEIKEWYYDNRPYDLKTN
ncbi:MAG TPA: hypothetical protein DIT07_12985, partial [Sphingobacteriaceae bacterium]|nr:hypothetical protein [Sphingobacteriaceae bacterium]